MILPLKLSHKYKSQHSKLCHKLLSTQTLNPTQNQLYRQNYLINPKTLLTSINLSVASKSSFGNFSQNWVVFSGNSGNSLFKHSQVSVSSGVSSPVSSVGTEGSLGSVVVVGRGKDFGGGGGLGGGPVGPEGGLFLASASESSALASLATTSQSAPLSVVACVPVVAESIG